MTQNVGGSPTPPSLIKRAADQALAARAEANKLNAAEKDGNNTVSQASAEQLLRDQMTFEGMPEQDRLDAEARIEEIIAATDANGDGEFDEAEFEALYTNHVVPQSERVAALSIQPRPWTHQPDVQVMQGGLNEQLAQAGITLPPGDYPPGPPIAVDGKFGPQTEAAVKALQEHWGTEPTGVADAAFLAQLGNGGEALAGIETSVNGVVEAAKATLSEGLQREVPAQFLDEYGRLDEAAYQAEKAHWDAMQSALENLPADHPDREALAQQLSAKQEALSEAYTNSQTLDEQNTAELNGQVEEFRSLLSEQPLNYAAIEAQMKELQQKLAPEEWESLKDLASEAVISEMNPTRRGRNPVSDNQLYARAEKLLDSGFPLEFLNSQALVEVADNIVVKHDGDRTDRTAGPAEDLKRVANALMAQGPEGQAALENWAKGLSGIELNRFIDFMAAEGHRTNSPALLSQLSAEMLTHLQASAHDGKNGKAENLEAALQIAQERETAQQPAPTPPPTGGGGGGVSHVR